MTDTAQALARRRRLEDAMKLSADLDKTAQADAEEGAYAWVIAQGRRAAATILWLVNDIEVQEQIYDIAVEKLAKARADIEELRTWLSGE